MGDTFTFTMEQIKAIYRAGIRRGNDEATAFEWGSHPSGKEADELIDELHEIWNDGKKWGEDGYLDWDAVTAIVMKDAA